MKITKSQIRKIIREEIELLSEYRIPRGFMRVSDIPIPGRESDLEWLVKSDPPRMSWNQNNGVIVAIPESGPMDAAVWVPEEKGGAPDSDRSVPYRDAIQALKGSGYKLSTNIYVPFSN